MVSALGCAWVLSRSSRSRQTAHVHVHHTTSPMHTIAVPKPVQAHVLSLSFSSQPNARNFNRSSSAVTKSRCRRACSLCRRANKERGLLSMSDAGQFGALIAGEITQAAWLDQSVRERVSLTCERRERISSSEIAASLSGEARRGRATSGPTGYLPERPSAATHSPLRSLSCTPRVRNVSRILSATTKFR